MLMRVGVMWWSGFRWVRPVAVDFWTCWSLSRALLEALLRVPLSSPDENRTEQKV